MSEDLFELYRGDDHGVHIRIADELGNPVDITGWVFKATMSLNPYGDEDASNGVQVDLPPLTGSDAVEGKVTIVLPHSQTQNLVPALYYFDVQREAYDSVKTVFSGRVKVKADVTRRIG